MITDAILNAGSQLLGFLLGLVPNVAVPAWLQSGISSVSSLFSNMGLIAHWFPVWLLGPAVALVVLAMASGFFVKVGRSVLSVFTGGGGGSG